MARTVSQYLNPVRIIIIIIIIILIIIIIIIIIIITITTNTVENPPKRTRKKWTRDEYKEIMAAYYTSIISPSETNTTVETYNICRRQNPTKRTYLDAKKLANVRRVIVKLSRTRLTDVELDEIKARVTQTDAKGSSEELPEAHKEQAQNVTTITEGGEPTASQQNTNSISVDEKVQQMKADILTKWKNCEKPTYCLNA